MGNDRVKVLYIAGWGRSGTTILDNILGQIDGFFSVGELRFIWDRNLIENRTCGCGAPFDRCEVWTKVLQEAYGGRDQIDVHELIRLRDRARTRHLPMMLFPRGRRSVTESMGSYRQDLEKLYQAIQSTTGSRVIVDSSKYPSYGYVLGTLPGIDLRVVHLVRDARGVAYSWLRKKMEPDRGTAVYMDSYSPIESSLIWNMWNVAAEVFWRRSKHRYMVLRYEDFVREPRRAVERILNLVDEQATKLPFVGDRTVELGSNHTVSGNPNRFKTGTVELRMDEEWQSRMTRPDRMLVTALTWPLLRRYGYPGWLRRT